jgi:hypothetical protein
MLNTRTYPAIIFRQRLDSPLQVAFVAPSSEIDSWARVPTKRTANIRNFQRAEIPGHIKEVESFFLDAHNASPTAVVVGFDPFRGKVAVRVSGDKGLLEEDKLEPGVPITGHISIDGPIDPGAQTNEDRIACIMKWRPLLERFIFDELQEISGIEIQRLTRLMGRVASVVASGELRNFDLDEELVASEEGLEDVEGDSADRETEGAGLEALPSDILQELEGKSPGERQVVLGRLWFLGQLQPQLLETWSADRLERLYREIYDELKPGILIDGQHRIMGTKGIVNVPFLVTALPRADWPELAFQFIVTNRTARRVRESLLISIVGNSLSKEQRRNIETRLRGANIRVGLIEAVMMVHEDEQSPFYGLVAFGVKNEVGFLDAAALRGKVIKPWYERQTPIKELFDHFCKGRKIGEKNEYWKSEQVWFDLFIAFWSAVRDRYAGSSVFSSELQDRNLKNPVSKLMTATVLMIFQRAILSTLYEYLREKETTEKVPISTAIPSAQVLASLVMNRLEPLTPEFFQGWQLQGFDGSLGPRKDLSDAIEAVVKKKLTVSQLKKEGKTQSRLFRKSGSKSAS